MPHTPAQARPGLDERNAQLIGEIMEMRRKALSYQTIAQKLGISVSNAHELAKRGLEALRASNLDTAEQLRGEMLAQIDWALEMLIPGVEAGKPFAIEKFFAGLDRKAKLLGLDAPTNVNQAVTLIPPKLTTPERVNGVLKLIELAQARKLLAAPAPAEVIENG